MAKMSNREDLSSLTDGFETFNVGFSQDLQETAKQLHSSLKTMKDKRMELEAEVNVQELKLRSTHETRRKMKTMLDGRQFYVEELEMKVVTTQTDLANLRRQGKALREQLKAEKAKQYSQMIDNEAQMELLTRRFMAAPDHYTDRPRLNQTTSALRNQYRRNKVKKAVVQRELAYLQQRYASENPDAPITAQMVITDANMPAVLEDTVDASKRQAAEREKELKKQRKELENLRQLDASLSKELVNIRAMREKNTQRY